MYELLTLPLLLYLVTGLVDNVAATFTLSGRRLLTGIKGGEGLQECYVCKPPEEMSYLVQQIHHQFPRQDLPICGREPPAPRHCPPRYKGCLTQYHGEFVVRLCGELKITACEVANSVEYCYCEGSLCNLEEKRQPPRPGGPRLDDEDSEEDGSGSGDKPVGTGNTVVEAPESPQHHPASSAVALTPTVLLILFMATL